MTSATRGTSPTQGAHGQIVATLGRRIVNGDIGVGAPIPSEAELLEEFYVSRTALREALRVLAAKGLVESRQKLGTRVRETSGWSLLDPDVVSWLEARSLTPQLRDVLIEFRRVIEPSVAEIAAKRASPADRAAFATAFSAMEAAHGDRRAYFRADLEYHRCLFAATGNPLLVSLGRAVDGLLGFAFSLQQHSLIQGHEAIDLHRTLLVAVKRGRPAAARAAMLAIVDRAAEELDVLLRAARRRRTDI